MNITKDVLEDLIWMSARYCVGRHTIASCMHADNIARILQDNPDIIYTERLRIDICHNINDILKYKPNVDIDGINNEELYSKLLYASNEIDSRKTGFYLFYNKTNKNWDIRIQSTNNEFDAIDDLYTRDLIPWVKLANWLDSSKHRLITIQAIKNNKYTEQTELCYPFPHCIKNKWQECWDCVSKPSITTPQYISPDYIINIQKPE